MPLTGTGSSWANTIYGNIDKTGLNDDEKNSLLSAWQNVCNSHITHITSNSLITVSTTGTTGSGSPGGPLPIISQPGTGTIS